MDKAEAERLVADAILLERAVKAVQRRYPFDLLTDVTLNTAVTWMRNQARAWRRAAESGG